ncbi:MAG: hypothetical protein EPN25_07015 [Nitrospirae bacterium]|nr:MAG: hypothetical protein EPN25_07015 [Nitrospirota bacterium]
MMRKAVAIIARNRKLKFSALAVVLLIAACATQPASLSIRPPAYDRNISEEEKKHADAILGDIELRNRTVEIDEQWVQSSYKDFLINNLADLDEQSYANFSKYLDKGAVYIIIHPAYYTFFQDTDVRVDSDHDKKAMNAMDRFLSDHGYSSKSVLIKAQEKMLRDFLEYKSTEKKLVVLILPKSYRSYQGYKYRNDRDEYMRFVNAVTNESESVIYLYSKKPNRGSLAEKDRKRLLKFLYAVRASTVMLGGGYAGRCIEDFYKEMEQYVGEEKMFLVPEITAISPSDITTSLASDLLRSDGTINISKLSLNIKMNTLGNQEITPMIRNLSSVD